MFCISSSADINDTNTPGIFSWMGFHNKSTAVVTTTIIEIGVTPALQQQSAFAITFKIGLKTEAPIATSGDKVYITWWSNKTGNDEVMFNASTDGGKTFGNKMNLSNSPNLSHKMHRLQHQGITSTLPGGNVMQPAMNQYLE